MNLTLLERWPPRYECVSFGFIVRERVPLAGDSLPWRVPSARLLGSFDMRSSRRLLYDFCESANEFLLAVPSMVPGTNYCVCCIVSTLMLWGLVESCLPRQADELVFRGRHPLPFLGGA